MNEELTAQQKLDIIVKCIDYGAPALKDDLIAYLNNVLSLANIYLASQAEGAIQNEDDPGQGQQGQQQE